ncbi:Arginine decarboxylase 2 [Dichanthelium oligosanthes]|uniref:Arginine decarboxylase n=1 Tax=Dichanthelium oligosanthes TaxID=888268 RepID=A0A1E5WG76_9POAL|nr:Arginine decarboxylase 2 [Dichanthelium oligosanthes]
MTTLDCGGGLGVDYDGTRSGSSDMSVAYGIEQYASSIVQAVRLKCEYQGVPHPVLCTESGQAMASHNSMIILEALSAIPEPQDEDTTEELLNKIQDLSSKKPRAAAHGTTASNIYYHAIELKKHSIESGRAMPSDHSMIVLEALSGIPDPQDDEDTIDEWQPSILTPRTSRSTGIEMYKLGKKLCKRVTCDANTIYNYHMMPVSRLNENPTLMGTLVDITCDSDGKIEKFISGGETLPLHPLHPDHGDYYVAALLSGAYQEALSCKQNLFSGPTLVRVNSAGGDDGGFKIESVDLGPTAEEVISTMRCNVEEDISSVIEELAKKTEKLEVWETVEPLMTKGLTTMPYLNEYKPPKTNIV